MADEFIKWLQGRLNNAGFAAGPEDGIPGRRTIGAIKAFQRARGLPITGTATTKTVEALRTVSTGVNPKAPVPTQQLYDEFPWMRIALGKKGLRETGDSAAALRKFLKSDGKTLGDPAKLPWCGDFVETCMALALPDEALPTNPYLARNWLKFGREGIGYGATLVFKRPGAPTSGHVGYYYAEDKTHYHVLGGNQSNSVSVTRIAKTRLLGSRFPLTGGPYRSIKVVVAPNGSVSTNEA